MKKRLAVVALLIAFVGIAHPVVAAENDTFGVGPEPERVDGMARATFKIPLEPGAEFEDAIRVYNRTDQQLVLNLYPADAEAGVDGTISVGLRGSHPKGVGAWIKLARSTLTLPPRGETVVEFRVDVQSSNPSPALGAIVIDQPGKGQTANLAKRLNVIVLSVPANTPTTSTRVRSLLLRSPWIIIAILGLLVALVLVWIGRRRSRRSRDTVVPAGEMEAIKPSTVVVTEPSRPVLRRLGTNEEDDERPLLDDHMLVEIDDEPPELEQIGPPPKPPRGAPRRVRKAPAKKKVVARSTARKKAAPARAKAKAKPKPVAARRPRKAKPAPKEPTRKENFIPLDDL
jgi:hypothetical protein